ncbi:MAG TPA: alpha/beta fold hydrolase [Spirochaetia bacterium]|nr:alpha/beta fold hydrolase [Spirochaetia bacterium]
MGALAAAGLAVGALLLLGAAAGFGLAAVVVFPRRFALPETEAIEREKGFLAAAGWDGLSPREVCVAAPDGRSLAAAYVPLEGSRRTVVLVHGITYTRWGSVKYLRAFRSLGFNALLVDQRGHGASGRGPVTFGFREAPDLRAWVDWALAELGPGGSVGLHGESMGAAVAIQEAAIDPRVAFVVADCPFSDLRSLLAHRLRVEFGLPAFPFLGLAESAARLLAGGFRFREVSPACAAAVFRAPLLLVHGLADDYIPSSMAREIAVAREAAGLPVGLVLVPGAAHAKSWETCPEAYERAVAEFLGGLRVPGPAEASSPPAASAPGG